uniref:Uncharacterized protein n=1 Tax=Setaria viridis TaxID=4556 RepID=A0A4U6UC06_SETVI|nr:hypothetical protein SEVIR_5G050350v2 [Setaria viridis]
MRVSDGTLLRWQGGEHRGYRARGGVPLRSPRTLPLPLPQVLAVLISLWRECNCWCLCLVVLIFMWCECNLRRLFSGVLDVRYLCWISKSTYYMQCYTARRILEKIFH